MKLQLRRLFRTATFRLAMAQVGIFFVFAFALLLAVYVTTAGQLERDAERGADVEFQALAQVYSEGGLQRLNEDVIDRIAAGGQGIYVLANENGEVISGSLDKDALQNLATRLGVQGTVDPAEHQWGTWTSPGSRLVINMRDAQNKPFVVSLGLDSEGTARSASKIPVE